MPVNSKASAGSRVIRSSSALAMTSTERGVSAVAGALRSAIASAKAVSHSFAALA